MSKRYYYECCSGIKIKVTPSQVIGTKMFTSCFCCDRILSDFNDLFLEIRAMVVEGGL